MKKAFLLLILGVSLITGCGSSGGGSSGFDGTFNADGFPDVRGKYSLTTKQFSVSCTDGSSSTSDAFTGNYTITQSINSLTLTSNNNTVLPSSVTVISAGATTGNVEKSGSFIITEIDEVQVSGTPGNITLTFHQSGSFTASGWSGTFKFTEFFQSLAVSCTFTAPFSGNKISSSTSLAVEPGNDFHDQKPGLYEGIFGLPTQF
jgi:hypothetical protein